MILEISDNLWIDIINRDQVHVHVAQDPLIYIVDFDRLPRTLMRLNISAEDRLKVDRLLKLKIFW